MPFYRVQDPQIEHLVDDFNNAQMDSCSRFNLLSKAAMILAKESLVILKNTIYKVDIETETDYKFKDSILLPIMRAGLPLFQPFFSQLHSKFVIFLSTKRSFDYTPEILSTNNTLPTGDNLCFLLDSVIGTGETVCAAIDYLLERGIPEDRIYVVSIMASDIGIWNITNRYKDVIVISSYIDGQLFLDASNKPRSNDIGEKIFGL